MVGIPKNAETNRDNGQHQEETSLKGTFVSVMLLGAFVLVSWVGVFILFIERQ